MSLPIDVCPCGGLFAPGEVEISLSGPDETTIVLVVPQVECPQCGRVAYQASDLAMIEAVVKSS